MTSSPERARELFGPPMAHGWLPHKPETWQYRYATLRRPLIMQHYLGRWEMGQPAMRDVPLEAGTRVKIVMVSRLGDVGITEDLAADNGYGARVMLDDLCNFGNAE
jgi:hypothetical protein